MRRFYIFKINPSMALLWKKNPYELFHTLEVIYYHGFEGVNISLAGENSIIRPICLKDIDVSLFKDYKNNYFYMKYKNVHSMHDVYRKEDTILSLHKNYIRLDTNVIKPCFFKNLVNLSYLFVCDFEEKDYFWLDAGLMQSVFI